MAADLADLFPARTLKRFDGIFAGDIAEFAHAVSDGDENRFAGTRRREL